MPEINIDLRSEPMRRATETLREVVTARIATPGPNPAPGSPLYRETMARAVDRLFPTQEMPDLTYEELATRVAYVLAAAAHLVHMAVVADAHLERLEPAEMWARLAEASASEDLEEQP